MKNRFLFLLLITLCFTMFSNAQTFKAKPLIKDDCQGKAINFGFSFAPTFDWMYPQTESYHRYGFVVGMRYGIPVNINLTKGKNFYVATGVYFEHVGGTMNFFDKVIHSDIILAETAETYRQYRSIYLTVPVGVTLKTKSINNFFICGNIGLYNGFRLSATNQDTYNFAGELWSREKMPSTETAILKESAFAGLGFEYSISKDFRAGLMVNYVHTLTNYFKGKGLAPNSLTGIDQKAKLGYVEIEAHINFF